MKLARDVSLKLHFVFDQLIPPLLRDSRWFMWLPITLAFRHRARDYLDFKSTAYRMSEEEFRATYARVSDVAFERETDLNHASITAIEEHIKGTSVLEVGAGHGFLALHLCEKYQYSVADIVVQERLKHHPRITVFEANCEQLPFADSQFDTVICTHTLEHVRNLHSAMKELRRVSKRLIIVVPRQRPYKYTFDLHLNFFPYLQSWLLAIGRMNDDCICMDMDGDIFYVEDKERV
jgi:ubiquinone/menaquinone biosynthesis C-methylase UbiE